MKETILRPSGFSTENSPFLTKEQEKTFSFLIREARLAKAYPHQSGFFVKTAGITADGYLWKGGNKEYSKSDAFIHGETAVISGLRDLTEAPIEAIAWYKEGEITASDFGRPCGNCRDVLKEYCHPETVLLNGNEDAYVYTLLKDFYFEDFRSMGVHDLNVFEVETAWLALKGSNDVYLPSILRSEVYGTALVASDGSMWRGGHYTNVGYDSANAALSAVINWHNNYPVGTVSENLLRLSKLVVVSAGGIPNVSYRDRQAILELDEILRRFTGNSPLKIELVHAKSLSNGGLILHEARVTNSEEWLPHPFSPGAFRMDDVIEGQLKKLIGA